MPALAELQAQMAAAVLADDPAVLPAIRDDGIAAEARMAIYRANTFVCQLVGDRFFAAVAQAFVRAAPPASSCLADYGGGFPLFLAAFKPAEGLPYLPDMARLDWAVHRAFHARDATALDPARVAAVEPALHGGLRLIPHPACHLVTSRYPVDRIWRAHQGDGDLAAIDLTPDAHCSLLVDRQKGGIRLLVLGEGEYALLEALFAGVPLGEALAAALARDAALDLPGTLARHLQRGTFCDLAPL